MAVGIIPGKETQSREVGLRYSAREQTARPVGVIRAYQVHLATVKKLTPGTCFLVAGALRFFFRVTLKKECTVGLAFSVLCTASALSAAGPSQTTHSWAPGRS